MTAPLATAADVVAFWREAGPARWYRKDDDFDREFRDRFLATHEAAARGDLDGWLATAQGALALCILLDQFPRNAFRGSARMFATDAKAREVARSALGSQFDQQVDGELRQFFIMPAMHSEDRADQELCVSLASALPTDTLRWAVLHQDIIERFGRFPHRNGLLGRASTEEERRFLDEGGFSG
ncbi:DUF924 family protein [Ramlibacter sp. PS3R-8]|uniref:DUF924 family protein n=1 Tax=Ramlibacter sp. PS3R-8 TaxID=3133437 RepID=UPI0030A002E7